MTELRIPGSKSLTARALFLGACADGESRLLLPLRSDDTEAFADGLAALGYPLVSFDDAWLVTGSRCGPSTGSAVVYCRDAGTAARFLPALAACGRGRFEFDASAQMRRRPMAPLVEALRSLGADVDYGGRDGHLPLTVTGRGLSGGQVTLDAGVSSQFLTALLMAAPLAGDGLTVTVTGMVSAPYVAMTVSLMRAFGAHVVREVAAGGEVFRVAPGGYAARELAVEPDASAASYFFAAAAVTGRTVTVPGLGSGSLQGDVEFVRVLARMGAQVTVEPDRTTVTGTGTLRGLEVNMRDISDTMPTLAAIAPFADAPVRIIDVGNTRVKECDRLDACATALRALGVPVTTGADWIEIWPAAPKGAVVDCRGDHRIAMSFAVTGLRVPGVVLDDPDCVRKTFPAFHQVLADARRGWQTAGRSRLSGR